MIMLLRCCRILLSNLMFHVAWTFSFVNQYIDNITKCRPFQLSELMNFSWWICFRMTYSIHSYVIDTTRCKKDFSQQNYWLLRIQPYSHLCTSLCFWDKICKEVSFFFSWRGACGANNIQKCIFVWKVKSNRSRLSDFVLHNFVCHCF